MATTLHRRTPSSGDEENIVVGKDGTAAVLSPTSSTTPKQIASISASSQPRSRVNSTPMQPNGNKPAAVTAGMPPSAGPYRTNFGHKMPEGLGMNGYPSSPLRPSFSSGAGRSEHSRTRSVSTPYTPPLPSPLSFSFPSGSTSPPPMSTSFSAPDNHVSNSVSTSSGHNRRHSRMHSRNLSIFFPRPGSLPQKTIAEDGSQEIHLNEDLEAPVMAIPSAGALKGSRSHSRNAITPLGANFTFGGRPPSQSPNPPLLGAEPSSASTTSSRRGHHHKHSLSHNFFSFLEPSGGPSTEQELHTLPTPMPISPWTPNSAAAGHAPVVSPTTSQNGHVDIDLDNSEKAMPPGAIALTFGQFFLGAWLWVSGQQVGSLSTTGLGYWIVFDSFGMAIRNMLPIWLKDKSTTSKNTEKIHRPYGNGRVETVFMFAQVVYLTFAAVYILKETVEHILLSAGGEEGHHHHHGDDEGDTGIDFPHLLTLISLISVVISAVFFQNHSELVNTAGNRLPPLRELVRSWASPSRRLHYRIDIPTSPVAVVLSNPYTCGPLCFCISILSVALLIPSGQQRTCDLVLASIISVMTFNVAYRACSVLGTVLLQTSPRRGLSGGKMEAFLRVMREVERHPQVLHLPAPHIWQLTPTPAVAGNSRGISGPLIVTLELHVREDLGDDDVLSLTKWTWEKCVIALAGSNKMRDVGSKVEVTVGIVRG